MKKLIKAIQKAARVSWDKKRKGAVEDESVPPCHRKNEALGSLLVNRYKLRISAEEDAVEIVVSR